MKHDAVLMQDEVALNLLYSQTVSEVAKGWILATKDVLRLLSTLQDQGAQKEVKLMINFSILFTDLMFLCSIWRFQAL